jgi:hypothetical protein
VTVTDRKQLLASPISLKSSVPSSPFLFPAVVWPHDSSDSDDDHDVDHADRAISSPIRRRAISSLRAARSFTRPQAVSRLVGSSSEEDHADANADAEADCDSDASAHVEIEVDSVRDRDDWWVEDAVGGESVVRDVVVPTALSSPSRSWSSMDTAIKTASSSESASESLHRLLRGLQTRGTRPFIAPVSPVCRRAPRAVCA